LNRLYHGLVRAGFFEGSSATYYKLGAADVNTEPAQQLARQAAADGIVLLKNDNTLPLPLERGKKKLAMIGFWANDTRKLQGGYSGPAPFLHTPVWAAQQLGLDFQTSTGPVLQNSSAPDNWTANALEAAKASDYIVYFGGQDTSAAGEEVDRLSLEWPGAQLSLIQKLSELKKPLVVVQMGDMLDNTPLLANKGVNSILWASWPGQDGGPAVLDILSGRRSVAGRLPVTQYPANYISLPMTSMELRPSGSLPGRTYRWYPSAVAPFGFGLHYTSFRASFGRFERRLNIQELLKRCKSPQPDTCALPPLAITLRNAGKRASDFVALAFVKSETGPKPYPLKTLAAYTRIRDVRPGRAVETRLEWTLGNVARRDEQGNLVLYPGDYEVLLDEPTQAVLRFTLTGREAVLERFPAAERA